MSSSNVTESGKFKLAAAALISRAGWKVESLGNERGGRQLKFAAFRDVGRRHAFAAETHGEGSASLILASQRSDHCFCRTPSNQRVRFCPALRSGEFLPWPV